MSGAAGSGIGITAAGQATANTTIYTSVTQKLRKERGQNLETFISSFMQSIEQTTDLGEDVIQLNATETTGATESPRKLPPPRKLTPPGRNLVFGDLFESKKRLFQQPHCAAVSRDQWSNGIAGPSKCAVYICEL